jgi:IclR family transcriptional regulator, KDG regulon repressor
MEKTLLKGLAILESLTSHGRPCGVSELARELRLSKSNTHRLLNTLVSAGFCSVERGQYIATLKMWELGVRIIGRFDVRTVARPAMERVAKLTSEGVRLAVLDDFRSEAVLIDAVESSQAVRAFTEISARLPIHCTASGKALLLHREPGVLERFSRKLKVFTPWTITDPAEFIRHIEKARRDGYVISLREYQDQVSSVGVPILGPDGLVMASISIAAPVARMPSATLRSYAQLLQKAAEQISVAAGRSTPVINLVSRRKDRTSRPVESGPAQRSRHRSA